MTLFALRTRDDLLAVRFAVSPVWETQAAVQALADERGRSYHQPWLQLVQARAARLDLAPLLAALPRHGYVPDFLTPPPRTGRPGLRDQLAEIRATEPAQVACELERCRETVDDEQHRRQLTSLLTDPERARDQLAARLHDAWTSLVAPFWVRIRTLLDRDIDERSRTLARHGLRGALDELHPKIRWTTRGLSLADRTGRTVAVDERGFLLMPSAYLWPHVAAIIEEPWQPTIIYPAAGIAELWQAPAAPPDALGRLLGRTRALILAALDQPLSTTALAAATELSPAGVSRHLLALHDAGLLTTARHGHEIRYRRTELGSALLHARRGSRARVPRSTLLRTLCATVSWLRVRPADSGCHRVRSYVPWAPQAPKPAPSQPQTSQKALRFRTRAGWGARSGPDCGRRTRTA
jgi:DNA-binding transcriptional ArsR family regulator